jgi:16S rRNA (cytosine967-C5)-methyltransferase
MRLGGRLAAAIEVLGEIDAHRRPVAEALKDWGVSHRFAGSGDRAAIGNLVYDVLRWRLSTAWLMGEDTPRALVLGTVVRHWSEGAEALAGLTEDDPHAPPPLTSSQQDRLANADLAQAPEAVRADVPEWLAPRFARAFGDAWVTEGAALALRPPLDMRVNRLKSDRAKVQKALARFGAAETPFSPDGLRIAATVTDRRHPNVQVEPSFRKGRLEIQDEGSQLAAILAAAGPGDHVLDLCAGAGGKTLAMAATMANKGQIFATDRDRVRLAPIFDRLRRAGTRNVQIREAGASLDDLDGRMDVVLVDAPCTGTGVWRRRPDAKWRVSERALGERIAEQAELLTLAARFVRPGGRLVYVTCSVLAEENDDRIEAFLGSAPGHRPLPATAVIARAGLSDALADAADVTPYGILLSPAGTGTDGFFVAVVERAE